MRIVVFFILSLFAHSLFIGGLYAYRQFYLIPKKEQLKKLQAKKEAEKKKKEEQKKKIQEAQTAKVVTPEEKKATEKKSKPKDVTKPTGKEEDYFKKLKPKKAPKIEDIPIDDEFGIE